MRCTEDFISEIELIVGKGNLRVEDGAVRSGSKDCFHFSPVLLPKLEQCFADAIVYPENEAQLIKVIKAAVSAEVPITPRGGGTGNYGQGVPMQGGLLINTRRMNQIIDLNVNSIRVEAGVNLWAVEKECATVGAELRMFPSTIRTSSAAGFITGGSGGIGSVHWGMLRDGDNIKHARIITVEAEPQIIDLNGADELRDVLHNCGLTAFVSEVTFSLAPKTQWHQYVYAFDEFDIALQCGEQIANNDDILKRLTTVFEWPIPSYFVPMVKRGACPDGKALVFIITNKTQAQMDSIMSSYDAELSFYQAPDNKMIASRGFQIYDFTWNHTTQWAMKANSQFTYLQDAFDRTDLHKQLSERKARFGDQIHAHIEFIRGQDGKLNPAGLSIVNYQGEEQLGEIMSWCEEHNIRIANPHTHFLDDDRRWYGDNFLAAKKRWDPHGLLNPGHLHALENSNG